MFIQYHRALPLKRNFPFQKPAEINMVQKFSKKCHVTLPHVIFSDTLPTPYAPLAPPQECCILFEVHEYLNMKIQELQS